MPHVPPAPHGADDTVVETVEAPTAAHDDGLAATVRRLGAPPAPPQPASPAAAGRVVYGLD
jgi:hypothetical protein